jgi:hypothetical protein
MFEFYEDILELFIIYDKSISLDAIKDILYLDQPVLQRQICINHEYQNLYSTLKITYDSLVKKLFIIEKYDIDKKEFYNFEKIGFEYSYTLICRNLNVENPNYHEYNNYYILVNTLNTIYQDEENISITNISTKIINDYFNKKNNILIKKLYKKYKELFEKMKFKKMLNDQELIYFTDQINKLNI